MPDDPTRSIDVQFSTEPLGNEGDKFVAAIAAHSTKIATRVVCTHPGKGFDGEPAVIVAYLRDGSVIPNTRYWREEISEVGGRAQVVGEARGGTPRSDRPGKPEMRQVMLCDCGIGFPLRHDDVGRIVQAATASGVRILELARMSALAHRVRDTP